MLYDDLSSSIIGACFEVSRELGTGFLESVYEKSLQVALLEKGIKAVRQQQLQLRFRGVLVGEFEADMVVDDRILVELKAVGRILAVHKAQTINYLKITGIEVGLLVNFGNPRLEYFRLKR